MSDAREPGGVSGPPSTPPAIRVTAMPADTNPYGGVFGGWIVSQMALAAGSLASRVSHGRAVVVAMDELRFPGPVAVGDELSIHPDLRRAGRTSLTIDVAAWSRERDGEATHLAAHGTFTFVAVDGTDRPRVLAPELHTGAAHG